MTGSGATGALTQLAAVGNHKLWTTLNPECTFWQQEYCRHSPFACVEGEINAQSQVGWGRTQQFEIARSGDLLDDLHLKLKIKGLRFSSTLPGFTPNEDRKLSWVESLGYAGIREAALEIGQIQVDTITGEFMEILEQFRSAAGNEQGPATGSFATAVERRDFAFEDRIMYIKLPFYFTLHTELALPIIALSAHTVKVKVYLREKAALINAETAAQVGIDVSLPTTLDATFNGDIIDAVLVTNMVFLDQFERNLVSAEVHEVLITEHQTQAGDVVLAGTSQKTTSIEFNNDVLCTFIRFREDYSTASANFNTKDYFAYRVQTNWVDQPGAHAGDIAVVIPPPLDALYNVPAPGVSASSGQGFNAGTVLTSNPFKTLNIKFNNTDRVPETDADYFTDVVPHRYATKKSKSRAVLMHSYHLQPLTGSHHPAGAALYGRIHSVQTVLKFASSSAGTNLIANDGEIAHFSTTHNVVRIALGQLVKKFA